ncbi:MAG: heparinase [bacterium]|nr:heparinase [bacterium]
MRRALPARRDACSALAPALRIPSDKIPIHLAELWRRERRPFFIPQGLTNDQVSEEALTRADEILAGHLRYFSTLPTHETGNPPRWHATPLADEDWPADRHWTRIPDLSPERGDIKFVWEPARFSQTFTLARAFTASGDSRYADCFRQQAESWQLANPPEMGPHWRCAQEMSFRCLAWIFGLYHFDDAFEQAAAGRGRLLAQIAHHAGHIDKVHWYARRCVRNNHTISEAVALLSIGRLLPFLPGANGWARKGMRSLCRELIWQIYPDGSYIQHSNNYARLVAQLLTWTLSLLKAQGESPPAILLEKGNLLLDFLLAQQDERSGELPNYGSNDGALLFPLSSCTYSDYRPALGALAQALGRDNPYVSGPWDEEALWFGQTPLPGRSIPAADSSDIKAFPAGGYYVLKGAMSKMLLRCGTYRHRPQQADMLHCDLTYGGRGVLIDAGTWSYNADPHWTNYFSGTPAHNTVCVDGRDQMRRESRFMWSNWTRARCLHFRDNDDGSYFDGEHCAYQPMLHRRQILRRGDLYLIVDDMGEAVEELDIRLHWLIADHQISRGECGALIQLDPDNNSEMKLLLACDQGGAVDWCRGDDSTPRGWHSLHYGEKLPTWSCAWTVRGSSARFATLIGPSAELGDVEAIEIQALPRNLENCTIKEILGV